MHIEIINKLNKLSDEYIVIGVSAGPDSMALLNLVKNNCQKKIICAHVNHNVRKKSEEEENYLKSFCEDNDIIFERMKINNYTENNFENEARKKRYDFYEKIMKKYHSHTLLLAHHGDDLIETIIMKIIRGSNLEGYAGIKTYAKQKDYTIIRPLLSLTKEDIIEYNQKNHIKYYIDDTNNDVTYTRNRIRKNILPLLKKEDDNVHLKFLKYSNTLQEYYNYIEDVTNDIIINKYKDNRIDIDLFSKEHHFMQRSIIFYILSNIYNNEADIIKDKHIEDIIELANKKKPNISIDLPHGYHAKKEYNYIYIEKKQKIDRNYKLEIKDLTSINSFCIKKVEKCDTDGNNVCRLNSNNIKLPLYLRNRKKGDYISLLGTNGNKKVKDIFIENKIPLTLRNSYPLLVDADDNILWIPNLKKSKYNVKINEIYDIILTSYNESEESNEKENK